MREPSTMWRFWWLRRYFAEGCAQLRAFLAQAGDAAPALIRSRGLQALGELTYLQGGWREAAAHLEAALAVARRVAGDFLWACDP